MVESNSLKVLICDDSILIRKKLKECLIDCGCGEILEASDGQNAVDKFKLHRPDLVFMDIVMPVKDGIEAVTEIIAFDNNAKIVMASSSGTKAFLIKALEAGAFDFIQKPFEEAHVRKIILGANKGVK